MSDNRLASSPAVATGFDEETPLLGSANAETAIETAQIGGSRARTDAEEEKRRRDELKGYIFMALSALGFATNSACVKALAVADFPSLEIVFGRSVVQLGLGLLWCLYYGISPIGPVGHGSWAVRRLLLLRGAAGAFGNACFFYAVTKMTLADATVVFFTGPVFSAIFASMLLGEPYGVFDRVASAVCMLGIVLVLKPTMVFGPQTLEADGGDQMRGAAAALVGAMSGALAYCVVRKVGRGVHSMVHVVYFGFLSMVGSTAAMYAGAQRTPPVRAPGSVYEWTVMGMVGAFAFFGQALLNRGLQLAPAGPGTLMRNMDVVFAFLFGITLFGEVPDWISVAGAVVIVGCTVAMGLHKWIASRASLSNRAV
ncbi:hypothetical protein IW140_005077 [Coemansia sp. RSA 1813]|nr:hypothetical protein LPJ74_004205 [Coemansia sp. RSA 1843]KAJ2090308.1 hypothetical protein IW138_002734 [Coemansia sp. RSA 986]KAJ2215498.1 hypothetical protein EV179_002091 [Coemansia sp. RSA 487]KAJ2566094.1 hypothetical protein IW140_005077 [Coemansia sp. RSA 1813]